MRRLVRWTAAAAAVLILWITALVLKSGAIEDDIAARAEAALRRAGQPWARAAISARDLSLSGDAPSDDARAIARDIAGSIWGVRKVTDNTALVAPVSPYIFNAGLGADGLEFYGHVPGDSERAAILAAARQQFTDRKVRQQTRLGGGAPAGFQRTAIYALSQLARLRSGAIEMRDRRVSIAGEARTPGDYLAVLAALKALPRGYEAGSVDVRPPHTGTFFWTAERTAGGIRLGGSVPDVASRRKMLQLARAMFPDAAVRDEMIYAGGAPDGLIASAGYALEALLQFSRASVRIEAGALTINGTARDAAAYGALRRSLAAPPAGIVSVRADIAPVVVRPFRWQIARKPDEIILSGYIPAEPDRNRVIRFASQQFPDIRLVDTMVVADGAPASWLSAAKRAIGEASRLEFGTAVLSDRALTITGRAASATAARKIRTGLASLTGGYVGSAVLTVEPAPVHEQSRKPEIASVAAPVAETARPAVPDCRAQATALLASDMIMFDSDSAEIRTDSAQVIARLAKILTPCGDARIGVAGHTDASGDRDRNLVLSQQRADAVAAALAAAGVPRDRLIAAGFGDTRPIADNKTAEGRTRNRRIEILVTRNDTPLFTGTVPKIPDLAKPARHSRKVRRRRPARAIQNFTAETR